MADDCFRSDSSGLANPVAIGVLPVVDEAPIGCETIGISSFAAAPKLLKNSGSPACLSV